MVKHRTVHVLHMGSNATRTYAVLDHFPIVQKREARSEAGIIVPDFQTPDDIIFNHCASGWERRLRARHPLGYVTKVETVITLLPKPNYVICKTSEEV